MTGETIANKLVNTYSGVVVGLNTLNTDIQTLSGVTESMELDVLSLSGRMETVESAITIMSGTVEEIQSAITSMDTRLTGVESGLTEKQDTLVQGEGILISGTTISVTDMMPIGSITMWAAATAPEGWLICNGQSITADTYTQLRTILGTDTVPDLTGKFPLGTNATYQLGESGGTSAETLTVDQIPSHNHELKDLHHSTGTITGSYRTFNLNSMRDEPTTVETLNPTDYTENTGGGLPHNNMPPYFALNFIIKYKNN